jgi:hypothetical protein
VTQEALARHVQAMRLSLARLHQQLEVLAGMALVPTEAIAPGSTGCQHPQKLRLGAATMEAPSRWICGRCDHVGGMEEMVAHGCS